MGYAAVLGSGSTVTARAADAIRDLFPDDRTRRTFLA